MPRSPGGCHLCLLLSHEGTSTCQDTPSLPTLEHLKWNGVGVLTGTRSQTQNGVLGSQPSAKWINRRASAAPLWTPGSLHSGLLIPTRLPDTLLSKWALWYEENPAERAPPGAPDAGVSAGPALRTGPQKNTGKRTPASAWGWGNRKPAGGEPQELLRYEELCSAEKAAEGCPRKKGQRGHQTPSGNTKWHDRQRHTAQEGEEEQGENSPALAAGQRSSRQSPRGAAMTARSRGS